MSFSLSARPPSSQQSALETITDVKLQLVSVGCFRLSSDQSAAIALYRLAPLGGHDQQAVLLIRLTGSTTAGDVQRAVRQLLAPAVEAATGTEWDNITSCSQLDAALTGLYLPPLRPSSTSSLSTSLSPRLSVNSRRSNSHSALPAGTTLSIELTGRSLRVWLEDRLVCAIESRMLNNAALASLTPLCTQHINSSEGARNK